MGLHCREITADCTARRRPASRSPACPGVIIGHNADIAWGFTNLGPDVTDLYLEKIEGETWLQDDEPQPLAHPHRDDRGPRRRRLRAPDPRDRARPAASATSSQEFSSVGANAPTDEPDPPDAATATASRSQWTALEPGTTADAILALNRASDWDEFRAAAADFAVPAQNLVYADREGHIGYQAPGRIPIRKSGNDGRMPAEGWVSANDWTGDFIPFDGLPSVLDPEEGFVVTANQAVIGAGLPLLPHRRLGPRLPLDPDPPGARGGGRALASTR